MDLGTWPLFVPRPPLRRRSVGRTGGDDMRVPTRIGGVKRQVAEELARRGLLGIKMTIEENELGQARPPSQDN